jgi:hypothetical protein
MSYKSYLRFIHTAEVYNKITTISPAGQKTFSFELLSTIPMYLQSPSAQTTGGDKRLVPYQEFIAIHEMIVPAMYQSSIDYQYRVQNIKDRYGNTMEVGPFEIVSIQPKFGWNGKKHHITAVIRKVVETS